MRIAFFDTHRFERPIFESLNRTAKSPQSISFFEPRLTLETAALALEYAAICVFANCEVSGEVIRKLHAAGLQFIALRSAGFNHVDLRVCAELGVRVARVPAYSPHAVAEHAVCLLLAVNRKVHRAYQRVRELNFSIDGLVGFDLHGKTIGVIGTGRIGAVFARIMHGFGTRVLAYDPEQDSALIAELGVEYVPLDRLFRESDVISLHVPLIPETHHIIDAQAIGLMKRGAILINTGRGALVDTPALIEALKEGRLGGAGLDVYEEEEGVFFFDLSEQVLHDDVLARLLTFPNVIITSHQGFLTSEALHNIAQTTLDNIAEFEAGAPLANEVRAQ